VREGQTCHYERIDNKWYVVWSTDFPGDDPGKEQVSDNQALYLEMGYQIGRSENE
jgi:hypothetical protein